MGVAVEEDRKDLKVVDCGPFKLGFSNIPDKYLKRDSKRQKLVIEEKGKWGQEVQVPLSIPLTATSVTEKLSVLPRLSARYRRLPPRGEFEKYDWYEYIGEGDD